MSSLWQRLPAIVRGVLLGQVVATVGGVPGLFVFWNLKVLPGIPWLIPATAGWLWLFWMYVGGRGWPRSTQEARRSLLRARPLAPAIWRWSLLAGGLALASVVALGFLTQRLAAIPPDAFKLPVHLDQYTPWTIFACLVAISITAGVAEEAAYRGYMLSEIERRHGWIVATLITGFVFFLDHHLSHDYATYAFLPFFIAVSAVHALLVYWTRSILPSIVLHAFFDFLVIPIQYGLMGGLPTTPVWEGGVDRSFVVEAVAMVGLGVASVPAFRSLASVARVSGGGGIALRAG